WTPHPVPLATLITVAGRRWSIEETFQAAKTHVGLDHYQCRDWKAWHRFTLLAMIEGPGIFRTGNPLRFLSRKRGCPCLTSAGRSLRNTRNRSLGWWSRNPRRFRRPPGKSG